jgi:diguanylate cyclase (GGDEF)-like protein
MTERQTPSNTEYESHDALMLSRLRLFRNVDLANPEISKLLALCHYRHLDKGEVLLSTEVINHYLFVLISGRLVIQLDPDDEDPLTMVDPGECVGEMSIIDNRAPSAQVKSSEPTVVLEIEQEILWRLVSVSHEIARNLLYVMSERVRYSNLVIADGLELQRQYQRFATIDALTGLHNRGYMDDMFDREIKRSERDNLFLCMIMIDVDNFKKYNDDYGHLAGDRVLVTVGEAVRSPLRPNDLVARFGGEEFAVLLPETSLENAVIIAERLREHVSLCDPGMLNGIQLPHVTISLGVTEFHSGQTLATMISSADLAMYLAKHKGKNCVQIAGPS